MRFGASLDLRMTETPAEFVAFLDALGLSHVELRQNYLDTRPEASDPEALRDLRERTGASYTCHAAYNDCNLANWNDPLHRGAVDSVVATLDLAAAVGAEAVVVHAGHVSTDYPDRVQERARETAVRSLRACAGHAATVGVPLCVENQRGSTGKRRFTETPARLAALLDDVGADPDTLGVALDVGHAGLAGVDPAAFVERFGDRIQVCHLHDNDGTADDHDPLPGFRAVAADVGAPHNVLEMKSTADVERCVRGDGG